MAILTSRPDITVTIEVNNQALKEYVDTTGEGNANQRSSQVTKYIESVPGAEFATRIRLPNKFVSKAKYDLLVRIKLDGQTVVSRVYQKHELHDYVQDGILKDSCTMRDGAGWCSRMFTFTQLQTVSTTSGSQKRPNTITAIGEIKVLLMRCHYVGSNNRPHEGFSKSESTVSEKQLKGQAISLTSKLGRKVPAQQLNSINVDFVDSESKSYATYVFRYRTMADLKAMYIVPRTPSPPPVEEETIIKTLNDRDIELLSEQELREIVRNMPRAAGMKRERSATVRYDDIDGEVEVTEERSLKRRFTKPVGEVIDLSHLDDD